MPTKRKRRKKSDRGNTLPLDGPEYVQVDSVPPVHRTTRWEADAIDELIGAQLVPNKVGSEPNIVQRSSRTPPEPRGTVPKSKRGKKPQPQSAGGYPVSMFAATRSPRIESVAERMIDDVVSGAVFDFAAYLTTRPDSLKVGAKHDAAPVADRVKAWSAERNVDLDNPDVQGWETAEALIDRVLNGEDVDEVTTTAMIAKRPLPMGMVQNKRRKPKRDKQYIVNYNEPDRTESVEEVAGVTYNVRTPMGGIIVTAKVDGKKIGNLVAHERLNYYNVDSSKVVDAYQRKGVATGLYRRAANAALSKGKPLRSLDYQSSPNARSFWKSEVAKGVVKRGEDRGDKFYYYPAKVETESVDTAFTLQPQHTGARSDPTNPWQKQLRRKRKQRREVEELLDRASLHLYERTRAPTMTMYHGTTTKFLRPILSQGLVPNPRMRVWQDDKSAAGSTAQQTRASLDGVYFAKNFMTAVSAGGNAHRKFGGTYLFVAAQVQPRSALADEDTVKIKAERALNSVVSSGWSDSAAVHWFEAIALDKWSSLGREVAEKLRAALARDTLPFGLGPKAQRIPLDVPAVTDYVRGYIEQAAAKEYRDRGDKWIRENMWRTKSDYVKNTATPEQRESVFLSLKRHMPTLRDAEARYLRGLDRLTKRYKGLAMPEPPGGPMSGFSHTLRIMEPVTYRGRNKIIAVFQAFTENRKAYIIVHYGRVTPEIVADMRKASWVADKNPEIVTAREAKRMGLLDKIKDRLPRAA